MESFKNGRKNRWLLLDKPTIQFQEELACLIGINEAIVLQKIHQWIVYNKENNKNFKDGRYWTYNSYVEWQKMFPFWSDRTVRRIFDGLEKRGLLITGNYNRFKIDNTKWYTIDYDVLDAVTTHEEFENDYPDVQNGHAESEETIDNLTESSGQNDHTCTWSKWPDHYQYTNNEETTVDDDSLCSSNIQNKALDKESKFRDSKATTVEEAMKVAVDKSRVSKSSEKKKKAARTPPKNGNTALRYFSAEFVEKFGGAAPIELEKDRKLMKQLVEHYGYDYVISMIDWMYRNWAKFRRECKLTGVPTVGMFFGFRSYLQEQIMYTDGVRTDEGVDSVWGV